MTIQSGLKNAVRKLFDFFFRVSVVFLFAVAAYIIILNRVGIANNKTLFVGVSAFFGAFFAFGFDRLSYRLTALRKRRSVHFSALVKIERLLNRLINQLDRDIALAKGDVDALASGKFVVWNLPPIPFSHDLSDDLMNIDFINDYFAFTIDIEAANRDMAVIMSMYDEVKDFVVREKVPLEVYKDNVKFTVNRLSDLIKFMENSQFNAMDLLAKARLLCKEQEQRAFLLGTRPSKKYAGDFSQRVRQELSKLNDEIEQTKKKSQEEIDRIRRAA